MHHARSQAAAVVLDNYLYVIGGNAPRRTVLTSVERYSFDEVTIEHVYKTFYLKISTLVQNSITFSLC